MIEFKNVTKILNGQKVLDNVSFKVKANETVLLVGSSGAGKTTILKLILRLIEPTSGTIKVLQKDISKISEDEMNEIRQKCGLVFQDGALFDSLTIAENVGFFLKENLKLSDEKVDQRVKEIMSLLGLEKFLDYYPAELSGGMKKRVAIARAIAANPQILLYDEPTAGLDPVSSKRVVDLIGTLQKSLNHTSLIVTHIIQHFNTIGDRLLMLKNSSIVYDGDVDMSIFDKYEDKSEMTINKKLIEGADGDFK